MLINNLFILGILRNKRSNSDEVDNYDDIMQGPWLLEEKNEEKGAIKENLDTFLQKINLFLLKNPKGTTET